MVEVQPLLPNTWDVPQVFRDRMGVRPGRQRAMWADGHLLLILHAPPGADHHERTGRFYWRDPEGTWRAHVKSKRASSLAAHLEEYEQIVHDLDDRDQTQENALELHKDITALAPLMRASRNLHAALQQAREMCDEDKSLIVFRDRAYLISRMAELAYQDAQNTLGYTTALQAEAHAQSGYRMSVSAHRLNVLAAFFFPMATLSAIFGVNLDHGFEHALMPLPFILVVVASLGFGFLLKSFIVSNVRQSPLVAGSKNSGTDA